MYGKQFKNQIAFCFVSVVLSPADEMDLSRDQWSRFLKAQCISVAWKWLLLVRLVSVDCLLWQNVNKNKKENQCVSAELVPDVEICCLNNAIQDDHVYSQNNNVQMVNLDFAVYNNTSWHQNQTDIFDKLDFAFCIWDYCIYTDVYMWLQSSCHNQ